jgi:hypothetical protein
MMLITRLGTKARAAVPALRQLANDEQQSASVCSQAAQTMFFITPETVPVIRLIMPPPSSLSTFFTEYSSSKDVEFHRGMMRLCCAMHATVVAKLLYNSGHTKVEVPYLIKTTARAYPSEIRAIAAAVLGGLEFEAQSAIPALRLLLQDDAPFDR